MNTPPKPTDFQGIRRAAAFTLIELLIVIAIIAILTGVAIPIYGLAKAKANSARSQANLRSLGNALSSFAGDNNGSYPAIESRTPILKDVVEANWVAALLIELDPHSAKDEIANHPQKEIFVSKGIQWPDPSGGGNLSEDDIINTYSATSALMGIDPDSRGRTRFDPELRRTAASIKRAPETLLLVEGQQGPGGYEAYPSIEWNDASSDLRSGADSASKVDFRYRNRVNALFADMTVSSISEDEAKELGRFNWEGLGYPKR